jgi:hypothetical protein
VKALLRMFSVAIDEAPATVLQKSLLCKLFPEVACYSMSMKGHAFGVKERKKRGSKQVLEVKMWLCDLKTSLELSPLGLVVVMARSRECGRLI